MAVVTFSRYVIFSFASAAAVVWHAFSSRRMYFPAMLFLASSKVSVAILGNLIFALAVIAYKLTTAIYLGRLRDSEVERINERMQHGIVEICLMLTIFRNELDAPFLVLLLGLALVKVFHWLIQDRVSYMSTETSVSRLQHVRTVAFLALLLAIDVFCTRENLKEALPGRQSKVGYHILFTFEYAILGVMAVSSSVKYIFSVLDIIFGHHWQGKGIYTLFLELIVDFVHFVIYSTFFLVTMHHYVTIPIHLIRDVYISYLSLVRRAANYLRYRKVTSRLHHLADAAAADVQRVGNVCIICREEMSVSEGLKLLHCGHVFHLACLESWLERQQTCPICRHSILAQTDEAARRGTDAPAAAAPAAAGGDAAPAPEGAGAPARAQALADAVRGAMAGAAQGAPAAGAQPADAPAAAAAAAPAAAEPAARAPAAAGGAQEAADTGQRSQAAGGAASEEADVQVHELSQAAVGDILRMAVPRGGVVLGRAADGDGPPVLPTTIAIQRPWAPATQEQQAAYAAACAAANTVTQACLMGRAAPVGAAPAAAGARTDTRGAGPADAASTGASSQRVPLEGSVQERARAAATAAVTASVEASKQLLRGHIRLLQQQLENLDALESASLEGN